MRRALALLAGVLCVIGFLRHRPKRVPLGIRCDRCWRPFTNELTALDPGEMGHVALDRPDQQARLHGDRPQAPTVRRSA